MAQVSEVDELYVMARSVLLDALEAVSYTHLDVYKRQARASSTAR